MALHNFKKVMLWRCRKVQLVHSQTEKSNSHPWVCTMNCHPFKHESKHKSSFHNICRMLVISSLTWRCVVSSSTRITCGSQLWVQFPTFPFCMLFTWTMRTGRGPWSDSIYLIKTCLVFVWVIDGPCFIFNSDKCRIKIDFFSMPKILCQRCGYYLSAEI